MRLLFLFTCAIVAAGLLVGPVERAAVARWVAQMIRRMLDREVADERS